MRHPAEHFIKFLIIKTPMVSDDELLKKISDYGFLLPEKSYLAFLRAELEEDKPANFDFKDPLHRESVRFLRKHEVYKLFYSDEATEEAGRYLYDQRKRLTVEQMILAREVTPETLKLINKKHNWHITVEGVEAFRHFYWNPDLLTYDEWGRFLYERSSQYERYMALQAGPRELLYYTLKIDQALESKEMIKQAQKIAFATLLEVNEKPGTGSDKVKSIVMLTKALNDCHTTLSTADVAMNEVLKNFEQFRMVHPEQNPEPIQKLAPHGNFTNSGKDDKTPDKVKKSDPSKN